MDKLKLPWFNTTLNNDHKCRVCWKTGKYVPLSHGLHQYEKGFWTKMRKVIKTHYAKAHPEYELTRWREGNKG